MFSQDISHRVFIRLLLIHYEEFRWSMNYRYREWINREYWLLEHYAKGKKVFCFCCIGRSLQSIQLSLVYNLVLCLAENDKYHSVLILRFTLFLLHILMFLKSRHFSKSKPKELSLICNIAVHVCKYTDWTLLEKKDLSWSVCDRR